MICKRPVCEEIKRIISEPLLLSVVSAHTQNIMTGEWRPVYIASNILYYDACVNCGCIDVKLAIWHIHKSIFHNHYNHTVLATVFSVMFGHKEGVVVEGFR